MNIVFNKCIFASLCLFYGLTKNFHEFQSIFVNFCFTDIFVKISIDIFVKISIDIFVKIIDISDISVITDILILGCRETGYGIRCKIGLRPTDYLGMPLGVKHNFLEVWDGVEERFRRRLALWKRHISEGGRLTFIKSTLSNLPIYIMFLFRLPKRVESDWRKCNTFGAKVILKRKSIWSIGTLYAWTKRKEGLGFATSPFQTGLSLGKGIGGLQWR